MKCKCCGAETEIKNGFLVCPYCGSVDIIENRTGEGAVASPFTIVGGVLVSYSASESEVVIPEGVLAIGDDCFKGNLCVQHITFPSSLVKIGNRSFLDCTALESISNYEHIISFGIEAFRNTGLRELTLDDNVIFYGANAFSNIKTLTKLYIRMHSSIKVDRLFSRCENLSEVECDMNQFYPHFCFSAEVKEKSDDRPTFQDVFQGTPFIHNLMEVQKKKYKDGECVVCGGQLKKGLFKTQCTKCGFVWKN